MRTRDYLVPAAASGTATAARLTIATLAFTAMYVGAEAAGASDRAADPERPTAVIRLTSSDARPVPVMAQARPKPGTVTISAVPAGADASEVACRRSYQAQALVEAAEDGAVYHWRLQRWSEASHRWRPYMSAAAGFADSTRPVRWRPQIVANPGWYRVEIKIQPGGTYRSAGFQVTC